MKFAKLTSNKWFKRLSLPVAGLLFLILLIALIINIYFSPVLSNQLKKSVFKLSNGLYQVDFEKSSLHVLAGRIVIDHLVLKPNYTVFNQLKKAGKAPNNLYTLSVDRIVFKHIHPFKLYFKNIAEVDEITISQPKIQAVYQKLHNRDLPDSGKKTYYQRIAGTIKSLHVKQILLEHINLRYQDNSEQRIRIRHLKEIDLKATDLLIDANSQNDASRFNFCKDVLVVFNNYSGETPNKLYQYHAKTVTFSSSKANIKVADAVFMPQKSATQITKSNGSFSFETDSINVNHFDYKAFISYRKIIASDIDFFDGKVEIFHDRTLEKHPVNVSSKVNLFGLLQNVQQNIAVKTVRFKGIDVAYAEISPKTNMCGVITLERLNGNINNIITGKDTLKRSRKITANLTANLMGYGKLDVNIHFDLADTSQILYYKGSLGSMNLVNLNPATKPLGLIQFTNGIVTSLNFDMQANTQKASGKVAFLYHDLNVVLLKQNEKNALKRMSFVSILANSFVLIRNNPTFNAPVRIETVAYVKPENVSYLGLIWRSIYSGIKESIGLSAEIEQNLRKRVVDFKENKEDRILKKANRQERRKNRRLKRNSKEAKNY
ncbi:MAG: hypothetical protein ACRYFA_11000 [Janthinobacterium lividum]